MDTVVTDYLGRVRRSLGGMDRSVRDDIVRELGANLGDAVRANGGNEAAAIASMGSPEDVARRYKDVYGYGRGYKVTFVAVAAVLGLFTLPVLAPSADLTTVSLAPTLILGILIAFLLWVSVEAVAFVGLVAGLGAAAARMTGFAILLIGGQTFTWAGLALLIIVSTLLVAIGWLPGKAKRSWKTSGASL